MVNPFLSNMATISPVRSKLFSAALASVMQERGINQVTLGAKAGLAVSRINNYLQGHFRTIKPAHVAAICKALETTPADTAALFKRTLTTYCRRISADCWIFASRAPEMLEDGRCRRRGYRRSSPLSSRTSTR